MKRTYILVIILLICTLFIFNIKNPSETDNFDDIELSHITCILPTRSGTPFWEIIQSGINEAADEMNIKVTFIYTQNNDGNVVIDLNDAIKIALLSDTQAIITTYAKADSETDELLQKAREAGIYIVMIDSDSPAELRDTYIGIDNEAAGYILGKYIADNLKEKVVFIPYSEIGENQINLNERLNGLKRAFDTSPQSLITLVLNASDYLQNQIDIERYLLENNDISTIIAINQRETILYSQLIERIDLDRKIQIYGFDLSEETLQFMQNGTITALISQKDTEIGYKSVEAAVDLIQNHANVQEEYLVEFDIVCVDETEDNYE